MSVSCRAVAATLLALVPAAPAAATEVKIFQINSRNAFLAGTMEGISVDPLGRLQLADRAERLTAVDEPFLHTAVRYLDGWVVGTGNAGRVLEIDRKGKVTQLFEAPESEVFALLADADGTVYAGTSPNGKVYRIKDGKGEVFFDPGETYIWGLERAADGSLLVATGTQGRLYRVDADGHGAILYDSDDTHLRSIKALPDGNVLVGTADEGLVLKIAPDGSAHTLYDAAEPEVVALAAAPNGDCYAAVVASEASRIEAAPPPAPAGQEAAPSGGEKAEAGGATPVVTVLVEPTPAAALLPRRRPQGPHSEVLRITPGGLVESLWSFDGETVYSLGWVRNRLWVGTGLEGKLYSWDGSSMVLEKDADERQVVAITGDDPGPAFATTNAAALYVVTGGSERQGTYTSPALDAGQISRFGNLHWDGEAPAGTALTFAFRSGISAEPDDTWSPWTEPAGGAEVSLAAVPAGRFLQWRAALTGGGRSSPRLYGIEISYRQENLRPKIKALEVLGPGEVLVPANFNPANQVFEPAHPNREGIFTTLKPSSGEEERRQKTLWKQGYRSLRWVAEDPNGDDLVYTLDFRRAAGDGGWLAVVKDLEDSFYSFDATVLPDGVYRFRLTASDGGANGGDGLAAEQVSEPVVIDHTPPVLAAAERVGKGRLRLTVRDALSPLAEAVVSVDAGDWQPAKAVDGLVDGREEVLEVEVPAAARLLLLRLTDAAHNVVTVDLSGHLPEAKRGG
jgi:hypothetical protein